MDTLRLLYETHDFGEKKFEIDEIEGWQFGSMPDLGLTWAEGHPMPGMLATSTECAAIDERIRGALDDRFGVRKERGVARSDQTVTMEFARPQEAIAFVAGMAAVQLPRCEVTRRGHPVHSIAWTHSLGRRKLARCYDKGRERGGEPDQYVRLEDQRRYASGQRPAIETVADPEYLRGRFEARFGPVRKAVDGVTAASFPVIAQALADEARYGYRSWKEAERLAGSLVLLSGGASEAYKRSTLYDRRADLREAGYVVVEDLAEVVEVKLADVVDQALEEGTWR